jgi:hypothetical protein
MADTDKFWGWQKLFFYAITSGYIQSLDDESCVSDLLMLIHKYSSECCDWILTMEENRLIKTSNITFNKFLIKKHNENKDRWKHEPHYPKDVSDYLLSKSYNSLSEVINDLDDGYSLLDCIFPLKLEIIDQNAIANEIEGYLTSFREGKLVTVEGEQLYSYEYQKNEFLKTARKEEHKYDTVIPITSYSLSGDENYQKFRFLEMVLSLSMERTIDIVNLRWKAGTHNHPVVTTAIIKILNSDNTATNKASRHSIDLPEKSNIQVNLDRIKLTSGDYRSDKGILYIPGFGSVAIAKGGRVYRPGSQRSKEMYLEYKILKLLFKTVNRVNKGITFSKVLGVHPSLVNDKRKKSIQNAVTAINNKVRSEAGVERLILYKDFIVKINDSYL